MKSLSERKSTDRKRVLVIGDSGSGKTKLAGSFPDPYFADFDNGLDVLAGRADVGYSEDLHFDPIDSKEAPFAWKNLKDTVQKWRKQPEKETFVLDSLTTAADSALRHVLHKNGRGMAKIQIGDWGDAITEVKDMLGYLTTLPCHVVVNAHFQMVQDQEAGGTYYSPLIFGQQLPPRIPMYFNDVWRTFVVLPMGAKDPVYKLQLRPSGKFNTLKNSLGITDSYIDEPTFEKVLATKEKNNGKR